MEGCGAKIKVWRSHCCDCIEGRGGDTESASLMPCFMNTGCTHLERVKNEVPACQHWWMDECDNRAGDRYCEAVEGSDAWMRLQPPPPPPPSLSWQEDGMAWRSFCDDAVASIKSNPEQLGSKYLAECRHLDDVCLFC